MTLSMLRNKTLAVTMLLLSFASHQIAAEPNNLRGSRAGSENASSLDARLESNATDLGDVKLEFKDTGLPIMHLSSNGNASLEETERLWSRSRSRSLTSSCITQRVNRILGEIGTPWSPTKTAYDYRPLNRAMNANNNYYDRRRRNPVLKPHYPKYTTDCSGFISYVIKKCSESTFNELHKITGKKTWRKPAKGNWPKPYKPAQVVASGYFDAFGSSKRNHWRKVSGLAKMRVGDIVVYSIVPYSIDSSCAQSDNRRDTGHIMFVLDVERPTMVECDRGRVKYARYKLRIADASKASHYSPDSRDACRNSERHDATPPELGCGIGSGWVYAWALKCTKRDQSKCKQTIKAMQMFRGASAAPKCPPSNNIRCHKYRIGRITATR